MEPQTEAFDEPSRRCLSTEELAALVVVDADGLEALLREEATRDTAY